MNWLAAMFRKSWMFTHFTVDDVLNAENEDALRDHRAVVDEVTSATAARRESNDKLRESLREARMRSSTFNEFSKTIRSTRRPTLNRSRD